MSSRLDVAGQRIDSTHDGQLSHHHSAIGLAPSSQDSIRSTLQSLLAGDFLDHHDNGYKEILRICITRILESFHFQSEATTVEGGTWGYSTDLQATFDERLGPSHRSEELDVIHPLGFQYLRNQISDQTYDPLPVNTLPERVGHLFHQHSPDLSFSQTSSSVNYELGTQPLHLYVPGTEMYSEGQTLSGSSASSHQQLHLPIIQGGQKKVKCTQAGCSSILNEGSLTRHVAEIHQKRVRDVCNSCGREFSRMYMKKNHICHGPHSKRRKS